jgi:cold shock protein
MRSFAMQTGTVIRFNKIKGYGFIEPDNGGNEIFVHFSQIQMESYKELKEGQRVSYELEKGERGEFAAKVTLI